MLCWSPWSHQNIFYRCPVPMLHIPQHGVSEFEEGRAALQHSPLGTMTGIKSLHQLLSHLKAETTWMPLHQTWESQLCLPEDSTANQSTNQPTSQPTEQPANRPTSQPAYQSTDRPTSLSGNYQPANQPTSQPAYQPTNQSTSQPTYQSTDQPTNQSISQPAN